MKKTEADATEWWQKNLVNQKKIAGLNDALLAEIEYLRMENEYLKKLIALVQKRENPAK